MKVNIVNGFSEDPQGGNPAGVVYLDEETYPGVTATWKPEKAQKPEFPPEAQMQKIACELHFSETAFITRLNDRTFAIRYFTPAAEVPLCGHATIASFSYLYRKGVIEDGVYELVTAEARLTVEVSEGIIWMEMDAPKLQQQLEPEMVQRICEAYGLGTEDLDKTMEVRIVKSGLRDIHVCVRDRETLLGAVQNEEEIRRISEELDVVGVHMSCLNLQNTEHDGCAELHLTNEKAAQNTDDTTRDMVDCPITAYCSNYAPLYEIPEECATGTSNGGLTYYLYQKGIIKVNQINCFLQGEHMNRPSKIYTTVRMKDNHPTIWVGGRGVICMESVNLNNMK